MNSFLLCTVASQDMSMLHSVNTRFDFCGENETNVGGCRQRKYETPLSSPARKSASLLGTNFLVRFWMLWMGRARHPGPTWKPPAFGDPARNVGLKY